MAISTMTSAASVLSSALNNISDLNTRFTNLPADYYTATDNLVRAIQSLSNAMTLVVDGQGTTLDDSSEINSDKDQYLDYISLVKSFIDANSN